MDTKIIDMIFRFGHILSITPQSVKLNRKLTYFQKFFGLLIYVLITTSFNFYFFAIKQINTNPSDTQRILTILMMVIFAMYDFNILIIVKFHKQSQWFHLMRSLGDTQCHKNKFRRYYLQFVTSQLMEIILILAGVGFHLIFLNVVNMLGALLICIEVYLQFFYLVVRCIILEMLLSRYQYQKEVLLKAKPKKVLMQYFHKVLVESKKNLYVLKEAADVFNDIFGWTTLLNIFSTFLRTLILLDGIIRNGGLFTAFHFSNNTGTMFGILYEIIILVQTWV
jgi:hypothetical protein